MPLREIIRLEIFYFGHYALHDIMNIFWDITMLLVVCVCMTVFW